MTDKAAARTERGWELVIPTSGGGNGGIGLVLGGD